MAPKINGNNEGVVPVTYHGIAAYAARPWAEHEPRLSLEGAGDESLGNGTKPQQILKLIGNPVRMGGIDLGIYANYGKPNSNVRPIRLSITHNKK